MPYARFTCRKDTTHTMRRKIASLVAALTITASAPGVAHAEDYTPKPENIFQLSAQLGGDTFDRAYDYFYGLLYDIPFESLGSASLYVSILNDSSNLWYGESEYERMSRAYAEMKSQLVQH